MSHGLFMKIFSKVFLENVCKSKNLVRNTDNIFNIDNGTFTSYHYLRYNVRLLLFFLTK